MTGVDHEEPSKVLVTASPLEFAPTATHRFVDGHDTPLNVEAPETATGVDQDVPSKVVAMASPLEFAPTAMHWVADTQDTALSVVLPDTVLVSGAEEPMTPERQPTSSMSDEGNDDPTLARWSLPKPTSSVFAHEGVVEVMFSS